MAIFGRKKTVDFAGISKTKGQEITNLKPSTHRGRRVQDFAELELGVLRDKQALNTLILCVIAVCLQIALILFSFGQLPPQVPLFYSRPWGEKILAGPLLLGLLPILVLFFTAINFWLLTKMTSNIFLKRIVLIFSLFNSFVISYALIKLVTLVI